MARRLRNYLYMHTIIKSLNLISKQLGQIVLPAHCLVCSESISFGSTCYHCQPGAFITDDARCTLCFAELEFPYNTDNICKLCKSYPLPFKHLRFLWEYTASSRNFIRTMKYKPSPSLLSWASKQAVQHWQNLYHGTDWDLIVPLPPNAKRLKARGLNQTLYITKKLFAKKIFNPSTIIYDKALIAATKNRTPQADLSAAARIKNMRAGFKLSHKIDVNDKRVLLVDDVATTGSSLSAAALAFLEHGASQVDAFVLAVAPRFFQQRYQIWVSFPYE